MTWSPEQDAALVAVDRWLRDPTGPQVFRLFGYAGTGKTTLARHFAENVDGHVQFGAFTGKAAHVLRMKGCENATTIHSLIYNPKEKSKGRLRRLENELIEARREDPPDLMEISSLEVAISQERSNVNRPAFDLNVMSDVRYSELVVLDECSMIDGKMAEDLLSFGVKVLVLGDPGQLPPVKGHGFFIDEEPNVMLTEVHRQARDNPIIHMATRVREGEKLELGEYGESRVITKDQLRSEDGLAVSMDQLLVGRNMTRHNFNRRMRALLNHTSTECPEAGEKLVCLRNNHDLCLMNGAQWQVNGGGRLDEDTVVLDLESQDTGTRHEDLMCHTHHFEGRSGDLMYWDCRGVEVFDYGYAMTVHKAQGSQWGSVMVYDEKFVFRDDARKWLYTGVTRAADRVVVVKP